MSILKETPWRGEDLEDTLTRFEIAHSQVDTALDAINAAYLRLKRIPEIDRDRLASYTDAALMVTGLLQAEIAAAIAPLETAITARREVMAGAEREAAQ
jgi:hypothetical protein